MPCNKHAAGMKAGDVPAVPQFESNPLTEIKHVIGVVSGKGGVGKSMVSAALATQLARRGHTVGILDADITGPSIPHMLGLDGESVLALGDMLLPSIGAAGIKVMSANLLLPNPDEPVLWRGPVIAGAIRQFWEQTNWGPLDYLVIDMPPGTGDVALTVFQSLPVEAVAIVTSPQDLVSMIVGKAVKMAEKMDVPVLGLVENMSYLVCPDCGRTIDVFGPSHLERDAEKYGVPALDRLPIDPALAAAADDGTFTNVVPESWLASTLAAVEALG
jgi:Mrp family chromosome partitioning ATPase